MTATGLVHVVGELDAHGDGEIELTEVASRSGRAVAHRTEEDLGVLGEERVADPSVGELAGQTQVRRTEAGDVHRERATGGSMLRMERPSLSSSGSVYSSPS